MTTERDPAVEAYLVRGIRCAEANILAQEVFDQSIARMHARDLISAQLLYWEYAGAGLEQVEGRIESLRDIARDQDDGSFGSTKDFIENRARSLQQDPDWYRGLSDEDYQVGGRANLPEKLRQMAAVIASDQPPASQ